MREAVSVAYSGVAGFGNSVVGGRSGHAQREPSYGEAVVKWTGVIAAGEVSRTPAGSGMGIGAGRASRAVAACRSTRGQPHMRGLGTA